MSTTNKRIIPEWRQRLHDELIADEQHGWMSESRDFIVSYLVDMRAGITIADLGTSYLVGQIVVVTLDDYDIGCAIGDAPHSLVVRRHQATRWIGIISVDLSRPPDHNRIQFAEALALADTQYEAERKKVDFVATLIDREWGWSSDP